MGCTVPHRSPVRRGWAPPVTRGPHVRSGSASRPGRTGPVPPRPASPRPASPRLASPRPGGPASPRPGRPASPRPGRPASPRPGGPASPRPASPRARLASSRLVPPRLASSRLASPRLGASTRPHPRRSHPRRFRRSSAGSPVSRAPFGRPSAGADALPVDTVGRLRLGWSRVGFANPAHTFVWAGWGVWPGLAWLWLLGLGPCGAPDRPWPPTALASSWRGPPRANVRSYQHSGGPDDRFRPRSGSRGGGCAPPLSPGATYGAHPPAPESEPDRSRSKRCTSWSNVAAAAATRPRATLPRGPTLSGQG